MGRIVPAVRVYGRRRLVALKKQLPDILMSGSEEPLQSLVLLRIEFPQGECSALARKDPVNKHHLDHIDELDIFIHRALDARLQRC